MSLTEMYKKATMPNYETVEEAAFEDCCSQPHITANDDVTEPLFFCVNCNANHNTPRDVNTNG